jgi:hypothetical protein
MNKIWRRLARLGRLAAAVSLLAACRATPAEDRNTFRSEANHLQVTLPPGWAASEGPEWLARPFVGLVAFDSWGKIGFWAPQVITETASGVSARYGPQDVLGQIPHDGAYVVLVHYGGGPRPPADSYGPEHEQQDLGGLWERVDCRKGDIAPGVMWVNFYKWGRLLRLEVYCAPDSSDETAAAVNDLLMSWRFDRVPAGDAGWATMEARQLLPPAVEPAKFPIPTTGPFQSLAQEGDVVRITQAEVRNGTVVIRFTYRWNEPARGSDADDCPEDRCHWWRFEARPAGEIVLIEEGGATLQDNSPPKEGE